MAFSALLVFALTLSVAAASPRSRYRLAGFARTGCGYCDTLDCLSDASFQTLIRFKREQH